MANLDSILKSRDITLQNEGPSSQSYGFSSSHIWMWGLDYKESLFINILPVSMSDDICGENWVRGLEEKGGVG